MHIKFQILSYLEQFVVNAQHKLACIQLATPVWKINDIQCVAMICKWQYLCATELLHKLCNKGLGEIASAWWWLKHDMKETMPKGKHRRVKWSWAPSFLKCWMQGIIMIREYPMITHIWASVWGCNRSRPPNTILTMSISKQLIFGEFFLHSLLQSSVGFDNHVKFWTQKNTDWNLV